MFTGVVLSAMTPFASLILTLFSSLSAFFSRAVLSVIPPGLKYLVQSGCLSCHSRAHCARPHQCD